MRNIALIYFKADSPFEISMTFSHENVEKECNFLYVCH